jgi:hypothetical protein
VVASTSIPKRQQRPRPEVGPAQRLGDLVVDRVGVLGGRTVTPKISASSLSSQNRLGVPRNVPVGARPPGRPRPVGVAVPPAELQRDAVARAAAGVT